MQKNRVCRYFMGVVFRCFFVWCKEGIKDGQKIKDNKDGTEKYIKYGECEIHYIFGFGKICCGSHEKWCYKREESGSCHSQGKSYIKERENKDRQNESKSEIKHTNSSR